MHFSSPPGRVMNGFTFIEFLIGSGVLFGLSIIFFPSFCGSRSRENARRSSCQSNLKQICLSFAQYTQDYDDRFPLQQQGTDAATGWAVALQPYQKGMSLYQCPSEATDADTDPGSPGFCDYFYNSNLSSLKVWPDTSKLPSPELTILIGDAASFSSNSSSDGGTRASLHSWTPTPNVAIKQGQWDPAASGKRHLDGGNYGFADGHVKWLRPEKITREPISAGQPTFRTAN